MVHRLDSFRQLLIERKAERDFLVNQVKELKAEVGWLMQEADDLMVARWSLTEAVRLTQGNLKGLVERLTTKALHTVFPREFRFLCDFETSHNRSECFLRVQEGDWEPFVPKEDQGGGILDVISIALRLIIYRITRPALRKVLWLDEPMKWAGEGSSVEMMGCIEMIRGIRDHFDIQMVINTHEPELARIGDRVFHAEHNGKCSQVWRDGVVQKYQPKRKRIRI